MKYISVQEFYELGFLQELNRQFLHPVGLALSVSVEDDGTYTFGKIWDYREDKDGMHFAPNVIDPKKAVEYKRLFDEKRQDRLSTLGYLVQPVDPNIESILKV